MNAKAPNVKRMPPKKVPQKAPAALQQWSAKRPLTIGFVSLIALVGGLGFEGMPELPALSLLV